MSCGFKIIQGDDVTLIITAKNTDDQIIALTGASLIFNLIASIGGAVVLSKTTGSGITITNASGGEFEVELPDTDTALLEGKYYFEVQVTSSSGRIITLRSEDLTLPYLYVLKDVVA